MTKPRFRARVRQAKPSYVPDLVWVVSFSPVDNSGIGWVGWGLTQHEAWAMACTQFELSEPATRA